MFLKISGEQFPGFPLISGLDGVTQGELNTCRAKHCLLCKITMKDNFRQTVESIQGNPDLLQVDNEMTFTIPE